MSVSSHATLRPETTPHRDHSQLSEVERHILQSLQHLRFGTLEIVVHDGRVVQVEKSEKLRFDAKGRAIAESLS
jgi:hypothetical protein